MDDLRKRVEELQERLKTASYSYYVAGQSLMSDKQFDMELKELERIEESYPDLRTPDSITSMVGSDLSPEFNKVKHAVPMLSIDNSYTLEELKGWAQSTGLNLFPVTASLKADGVSLSLTYEDGVLIKAATRGDGAQGDDVTENAKTVRGIPGTIPAPGIVEVRGECVLPTKAFLALNRYYYSLGKKPFENPRNAASGTLKSKSVREVYRRGLEFRAFDLTRGPRSGSHYADLETLVAWGFKPVLMKKLVMDYNHLDEIQSVIKKIQANREAFGFDIDGVVIKVDDQQVQQTLGHTSKHLRYATAWKFDAQVAQTRIKDVTLQVGRTGRITPVAELDPVRLAGTTIKRATLHNFDEIQRLNLHIGDMVSLEKGGEIIPKITGVDLTQRPVDAMPITPPECCPVCGGQLEESDDVDLRCSNVAECPPQKLRRLTHFVGRDYMKIDDFGPSLAEQLMDFEYVSEPFDIYKLKRADLRTLPGLGEKMITKLLAAIDRSKGAGMERLLAAMGIRQVGRTLCKDLGQKFGDLRKLWSVSDPQLLQDSIEGMGSKSASSLYTFIQAHPNFPDQASSLGLSITSGRETTGTQFEGEVVVLTGTLPSLERSEMTALLEAAGARVTSSVSKKTTLLVAGAEAGSKLKKAQDLGIPILDEAMVMARLA